MKDRLLTLGKPKRFSLTKTIEKYIRAKLKQDWSPEQIAGRMKLDIDVRRQSIDTSMLIKPMVADSINSYDIKIRSMICQQ